MTHFKIFFSISLGIHLLAFSLVSLFPQETNIDPIRKISIDVALLLPTPEAIAEEKPVKKVDLPPKEKTVVKKEEPEKPLLKDDPKPEIQTPLREEPAPELPSPPVVVPVVAVVEPQPSAPPVAPVIIAKTVVEEIKPQPQKQEETTKEEPRREQSPPSTWVAQLPSPRIWSDESPIFLRGASSPRDSTSAPVAISHTLPARGTQPSETPSPKEPVNLAKTGPSSEETFLAQPRYLKNPKPLYPPEAKKKGYQGEVLLRVEIFASGEVGQVEVKKSSGHEILDRSALAAVKQWRFIPAKKGANTVAIWVNIPVKFQIE
jgi:periplasmic protein TonB